MYDSVTPSQIPADALIVAGYVDPGMGQWKSADWKRFPKAQKITITRTPSFILSEVLDVENGAASPIDAPLWAQKVRYIHGAAPVVYTSSSNWQACINAFNNARVPHPLWWLAQWDGIGEIPGGWAAAGVVAKQYRSPVAPAIKSSGWYDISVTVPSWPAKPSVVSQVTAKTFEFFHWLWH